MSGPTCGVPGATRATSQTAVANINLHLTMNMELAYSCTIASVTP